MKKLCTYAGVTLALAALCTLALPLFRTGDTLVRGVALAELSPWGAVVVLAPLAAVGIALGRLPRPAQTIGFVGLFLLDGVALSGAVAAARQWIHALSDGFVQPYGTQWLYAVPLGLALFCLWLAANLPDPAPAQSEAPDSPAAIIPEAATVPANPGEDNTHSIIDVELYQECDGNEPKTDESPAADAL